MTLTVEADQEFCACGCGAVIFRTDDHPWFKTRSCQNIWTRTSHMSEEDRRAWAWQQRFYFHILNDSPWGGYTDWEREYADSEIIAWANRLLAEADSRLVLLDLEDPDALADALRILLHYSWMSRSRPDVMVIWDKVPAWVFELRDPRGKRNSPFLEALKQYGIVPLNWTGPSV